MGIQTITTIQSTGLSTNNNVVAVADQANLNPEGFLWTRGERNFVFSSSSATTYSNSAKIKIQASFGQNGTYDSGEYGGGGTYTAHPSDPHDWIDLRDADGAVVEITKDDIISVKLGQCKLRFVVTNVANLPTGGVKVKIS
jgi:hypothetical protein